MNKGFSTIEVLLASSILILIVTAFMGAYIYGSESTALAGSRSRATFLAEEGLEASRNIRDASFSNLTNGTFGLTTTGNQWNLSGSSDFTDIFTRAITISTVDAITSKLETSGIEAIGVDRVNQAIERLENTPKIDAVWLDHYLPEKDGTELVLYMKKPGSKFENTPIFLVSNTAGSDKVYEYLHLGVNKYFVKADNRLDDIIADIQKLI